MSWSKPDFYDELDLEVHVLFNDVDVCVDPEAWVGYVLRPEEVEPLRTLGTLFGALIDDLGDVPDATYLADPRWPEVVVAAGTALAATEAPE